MSEMSKRAALRTFWNWLNLTWLSDEARFTFQIKDGDCEIEHFERKKDSLEREEDPEAEKRLDEELNR